MENNVIYNYNQAKQELYDYFGFKDDWAVFPIEDRRRYWWSMTASDVTFYDSLEAYQKSDGDHTYSDSILHHRFYQKAVYPGKDYTLVMVDTHTDGNKFLAIYDNSKRVDAPKGN